MATEKTGSSAKPTVAEDYAAFGAAFEEATLPEGAQAAASSDEGAQAAAGTQDEGAQGVQDEGAQGVQDEGAQGVQDEGAQGAQGAQDESSEARIAALEAENAALKAKPSDKTTPAAKGSQDEGAQGAQGAQGEPAKPAEPEWYKPTAEEQTVLEAYVKEWPEISAAEAIRTKQAVYNAIQYVFHKIAETYTPVLQRFGELSEIITERMTLDDLRRDHNDYDTIYDQVNAWVETLPGPFKLGAQQVMKEGDPAQVSELIATFKAQKQASAAPAAGAQDAGGKPPLQQGTTELSAPAKKAAKALTVVGSKRTTPTTAADANDFDGAWLEAVNTK